MNKEIGAKVRKLRELHHISQSELALKSGIAQSTLSYIENGKKVPQFDTLSAICRGLNISILELFSYDVLKTNKKLFEQSSAGRDENSRLVLDGLTMETIKELYESERRLGQNS
jgi:transcriptional regulator with XRE-family HTH domain